MRVRSGRMRRVPKRRTRWTGGASSRSRSRRWPEPRRSTPSSPRSSRKKASRCRRRRMRARLADGFISTSPACRRHRRRWTLLPPIPRRTNTSGSWTGCWPRRTTVNAGRGTGWMWSTTATRMDTTRTSRGPMRGRIAITSFAHSTTTNHTRALCRSSSREMCFFQELRTEWRRSVSSPPDRGISSDTWSCRSRRLMEKSRVTSTATT